jgi:hypothetical protein
MSLIRPKSREEFFSHLHDHHMFIFDVAIVQKPSIDGEDGDSDQNSSSEARAHSSVLTFFSLVFNTKLKGMNKSSEGTYIASVDIDVSTQAL